ncbi:MAG: hypothetical protein Greene041619_358 [Candidatus Peregrinibacteria bacterium Greene0416_19]|nr:MAG: hypothetical protein Greene041619_358 [Candidatus Peregrinibacteria bacterium Greene0416_19]
MKVYHLPTDLAEAMICQPREIPLHFHYLMPNTIGRVEQEEAAARILSFSRDIGEWTGVSWNQLVDQMRGEYEEQRKLDEWNRAFHEMMDNYGRKVQVHFRLSVLTLGVYALLVQKPQRPGAERPQVHLPFSGIFAFGPGHVVTGIHELLQKEFLQMQTDEVEGTDIFYPTPKLVHHLLHCQG